MWIFLGVRWIGVKKGKGKDVDLYSAFHAPGTANGLTSLKLDRQTAILGHRLACKHSLGSDPITGTGSASQQ